jgi:hypothetical protein
MAAFADYDGAEEPPEPERLTIRSRLLRMLEDALYRLPYVPQLRIFAGDLRETREWWPLLLPVLLLIGWRNYRRERREHLRRRLAEELLAAAERGDLQQALARRRKHRRNLLRPGK